MADERPQPTRASLRQLLNELFPLEAQLRAFCIDHFPAVAGECGDGMPRSSRLSLLLEREPPAAIAAALQEHLQSAERPPLGREEVEARLFSPAVARSTTRSTACSAAPAPREKKQSWRVLLLSILSSYLAGLVSKEPLKNAAGRIGLCLTPAKQRAATLVGAPEWRQLSASLTTAVMWLLVIGLVFLPPPSARKEASPALGHLQEPSPSPACAPPAPDQPPGAHLGKPRQPAAGGTGPTSLGSSASQSGPPGTTAEPRSPNALSAAGPNGTGRPDPRPDKQPQAEGMPVSADRPQASGGTGKTKPQPENRQPAGHATEAGSPNSADQSPAAAGVARPPKPNQVAPAGPTPQDPETTLAARPAERPAAAVPDEEAKIELQWCKSKPLPNQPLFSASRSRPQIVSGRRLVTDRVRGYVCIPPYAISSEPVSQGMYQLIVGEQPQKSEFRASRPVLVSYLEAAHFCNAMSEKEGLSPCYEFSQEGSRETVAWRNRARCSGYRLPAPEEAAAYHRGTDNEWTWVTSTPSIDQIDIYEGIPRGFYVARSLPPTVAARPASLPPRSR